GSSILHLYRRLLAARRASPALVSGDIELLDAPAGVLAYERSFAGDRRGVGVNFSDRAVEFHLTRPPGAAWSVQVASDASGEGELYRGSLGPSAAVVLTPVGRPAGPVAPCPSQSK